MLVVVEVAVRGAERALEGRVDVCEGEELAELERVRVDDGVEVGVGARDERALGGDGLEGDVDVGGGLPGARVGRVGGPQLHELAEERAARVGGAEGVLDVPGLGHGGGDALGGPRGEARAVGDGVGVGADGEGVQQGVAVEPVRDGLRLAVRVREVEAARAVAVEGAGAQVRGQRARDGEGDGGRELRDGAETGAQGGGGHGGLGVQGGKAARLQVGARWAGAGSAGAGWSGRGGWVSGSYREWRMP